MAKKKGRKRTVFVFFFFFEISLLGLKWTKKISLMRIEKEIHGGEWGCIPQYNFPSSIKWRCIFQYNFVQILLKNHSFPFVKRFFHVDFDFHQLSLSLSLFSKLEYLMGYNEIILNKSTFDIAISLTKCVI
jgi:hypothetical protein